jgi:hypothetical protein
MWVLINGEARGHSELARQNYALKDTSQWTNLCKRFASSTGFQEFRNE